MKQSLYFSLRTIIAAFIFAAISPSAKAQSVWIMDFVEVKNQKEAEVAYFIRENWQVFRVEALKQGIIKSYKVLKTAPDSTAAFRYILMTEYTDSTAVRLSEERFRPILKALRPNGPRFLNESRPKDFWRIPISKEAVEFIHSNEKK
jgi:CTP:molybdopterin cytidylyltransferase MocA